MIWHQVLKKSNAKVALAEFSIKLDRDNHSNMKQDEQNNVTFKKIKNKIYDSLIKNRNY